MQALGHQSGPSTSLTGVLARGGNLGRVEEAKVETDEPKSSLFLLKEVTKFFKVGANV